MYFALGVRLGWGVVASRAVFAEGVVGIALDNLPGRLRWAEAG